MIVGVEGVVVVVIAGVVVWVGVVVVVAGVLVVVGGVEVVVGVVVFVWVGVEVEALKIDKLRRVAACVEYAITVEVEKPLTEAETEI